MEGRHADAAFLPLDPRLGEYFYLGIDDFMKAGGTARGMAELAEEVGAKVVGKAFFIATQEPEKKMIDDYTALFVLKDIDTENRKIDISPL